MDNDTPYLPDPSVVPEFGSSSGFEGLFGFMVALIVIGGIVTLIIKARNIGKVIQSGNDPTTFETDLAIKAMNSQSFAPAAQENVQRSTGERLAELDALLSGGNITQAEYDTARAKVLGEI